MIYCQLLSAVVTTPGGGITHIFELLATLTPNVCSSSQLLEYMGEGKSIVDVGLAQARRPLNTRFHYYELEITDAGEKCYIALGLARRVRGSQM